MDETAESCSAGIFSRPMTIERHLILQELTLNPGGEWTPQHSGWIIARVADGAGYWMHGGNARELNIGDGLVAAGHGGALMRASQLGPLKLQYFTIQPHYLNGVLTVSEWHHFEAASKNLTAHVSIFVATDPVGQKFTRLVEPSQRENLPMRCALLQLWAGAVAGLLAAPVAMPSSANRLCENFRRLVGQIPEAEFSKCSLSEMAAQLHCSERHFSRLFREEFGVSFRARQIELRLLRAQQLLAASDDKVINVAYESGYRHLGLFNAIFKKRFGMTPSEWRQQNTRKSFPVPAPASTPKPMSRIVALLAIFLSIGSAQTNPPVETSQAAATNAPPGFRVEKYMVSGNTILPPKVVADVFTNVPDAFGTNVTFAAVREALGGLQMAYRARGFATVSVSLPQQKLTNATIRVKVIEGNLVAINVQGNRFFSDANVLRALPSLQTNVLLNSKIFQNELDIANANRNRQIYPIVGPGPEPGTSELTLKVKDRFPLHARLELNNQFTPGTPDYRINYNMQYDNLWDLEHQIGLQYSFAFKRFKGEDNYTESFFDEPQIANYSAYYRLPLGRVTSVQEQINDNPSSFGYNEITHQFNLPPPSGRPDLTFYASRSTSDTAVILGPLKNVISTPLLTIDSQDTGDNTTLNEGLGMRMSLPLPRLANLSSTLSAGLDFKRFRMVSYNTNNFYAATLITNSDGSVSPITSKISSGQTPHKTELDYLPLNVGVSGSIPDKWGTTAFNVAANFNVLPVFSRNADFAMAAYTTNARAHYVTVQMGADREQRIYKDWTVKIHADGQWADGPLIGNEQFAMGGAAGVRGYPDGEAYGDTGWRVSIEPRTPMINIGMVDGDKPFWVRASVFMDYGQVSALDRFYARKSGITFSAIPGNPSQLDFWGVGWSITANVGEHFDARLTMGFPLINQDDFPRWSPLNNLHIYFGAGAQF